MTPQDGIFKIKEVFGQPNQKHTIPLMKVDQSFEAYLTKDGIVCSNLGQTPLLEWKVFEVILQLLTENGVGEKTKKGDAVGGKLGDNKLPLNSVEGRVAYEVYEKKLGISVFRKISAISGVLAYAGICTNGRGYLTLNPLGNVK